jgi:glycosyltransferase involved in cell wall biosynthesis
MVATHPVNRGQGDALRTGFALALQRGADVIVTMDADGQHRPDEIVELVKPILLDEADYVQGSRFLGRYDDAGGSREIGIHIFSKLINVLSGTSITDCTNGFRAIRAEALAELRLEEDRYSSAELIMEAAAKRLRILEIPVHVRSRSHGESKKPARLGYPLGWLGAVLRVWLR